MKPGALLADLVVVVHLAYLGYVVVGGFLALRDLRWLVPHLGVSTWGVIGTVTHLPCPLTELEKWLDATAGAAPYDGPFISHYLVGTLYPTDAQALVWQATAAIVAASYVVAVVHHLRERSRPTDRAGSALPS